MYTEDKMKIIACYMRWYSIGTLCGIHIAKTWHLREKPDINTMHASDT